jgi:hypothetical protein
MILRARPALLAAVSLVSLGLASPRLLTAGPALAQGTTERAPARNARPAAKPAEGEEAKPAARGRRGAERAARPAAAPAGLQATPVAVFGDWNVFAAGQGRTRICYAITQPKTRLPASLKRDAAYLFVTVRKAENLPNEVALMMGFAARPGAQAASAGAARGGSDPAMTIGAASYALVVKDANAWLSNPADEAKVVGEMGRAQRLVVKATSLRGNASTDEYSLAGFGEAMKRTRDECK